MSTAGNERGSAPIFCGCGQRGVRSQWWCCIALHGSLHMTFGVARIAFSFHVFQSAWLLLFPRFGVGNEGWVGRDQKFIIALEMSKSLPTHLWHVKHNVKQKSCIEMTSQHVKWNDRHVKLHMHIYIPTSDIFTCQHIFQMPHITIDIFRRSKSA